MWTNTAKVQHQLKNGTLFYLLYYSNLKKRHPKQKNSKIMWYKTNKQKNTLFLTKFLPLKNVISSSGKGSFILRSATLGFFFNYIFIYICTHTCTHKFICKKYSLAIKILLQLLLAWQPLWPPMEALSELQEVFLLSALAVITWSTEMLHSRHQMGW